MRQLVLYIANLVIIVYVKFYVLQYVTTDEFYDRPFWYRLFYFVPMFFVFRTRLYFAWLMAEAMCVTATLGCYPIDSKPSCGHGPNDLKQLKARLVY